MDAGAARFRQAQVWFEADTDNPSGGELHKAIQFSGPIPIGFRQIEAERWTTTRFYMMDFASPAARNNARNRLPYTVKLAFTVAESCRTRPTRRHGTRGNSPSMKLKPWTAPRSIPATSKSVFFRPSPADEGYWLDTGVFNIL